MNKRDLLNFTDVSRVEMQAIFGLARELKRKQKQGIRHELLRGKGMALVFEKPSLRTRVSFEVGMAQLGGYAVFLGPTEIGMGSRETPADCARNLARWVDIITVRTFSEKVIEEMADRKSTRLNSSHQIISYAVFCLKKKKTEHKPTANI